jgi:phosphoribosyl-ATP pyrophosphohydrolase/phosphoribosyl-AMP cyclohydrolase
MRVNRENLDQLKFDAQGLVPAIVQDVSTREVLMMAYMNREALELTLDKGESHFFSRSRGRIWHKGETSGNRQSVEQIRTDCDRDTLLVEVTPWGPACHNGTYSCFEIEPTFDGFIRKLYGVIQGRKESRPEGSYTAYLFNSGLDKILKKIGEESAETIIAAKNESSADLVGEASDMIYHLLVLLVERGISLEEITRELESRHATKSGRS